MLRILLLLLTLGLLCAPASLAARAVEPELQAIDGYVQKLMQEDRIPGVAIAIVRDQQIVYLRGYGEDGRGEPVAPETGFILGSMSKSFTALAIMQLVERGAIQLDDTVQRYLPDFRVADPAASASITVRHLLYHTSGIPTKAPQANQPEATLYDHVQALAGVELNNEPGAVHEYASPNYLVLGAIIERVTGQPFGKYVQEAIFAPLQMQHSATDAAQAEALAVGHRYWFGFPLPADLPYEADRVPTAAVISSASDLAHYMIAQLNEGRFADGQVLSPAGMAELQRPAAPDDGFSYAMGWRVGPIHDVPAIHHGGIVPHFRGKMVLLPEQGWGVAVLTNASTSLPLPIMPSSHRMADGLAAYLAGQSFPQIAYSQGMLYLVVTLGLALVLFSQIAELIRLKRWRTRLDSVSHSRLWFEVGIEFFWPVFAVAGLPLLLGLPWAELARGTPDLTLWLVISIVLSLLVGLRKAFSLLRHRSADRSSDRATRANQQATG
jgi:CubicO group peptidase (beta-lactamase class C family)